MVTPSSVLQVTLAGREETLLKQEPVLGDFDPGRYTTSREWAEAPDGTRVPISVVRRRDLQLPAPTVVYGYGAYEISIDPSFSHHRLSLLDRGAVFAIAHVRGGGEMGRAWYEDGRMEHKAHTFSDFLACARHLIASGLARSDALAGRGGSAGGLLIGAVANQAPRLFRRPGRRGSLRRLRHHHARRLPAPDRRRMGGVGQPRGRRVRLPPHAQLFAVRQRLGGRGGRDGAYVSRSLRHRRPERSPRRPTGSRPNGWPSCRALSPGTRVLLRTEMGAGHAGPSGRYDAWKEEALVLAFLLETLGLDRDI